MSVVVGIDPGYEQSAIVLFDGRRVVEHAIAPNSDLLKTLETRASMLQHVSVLAIVLEQIESFGMAVGREVFETVFVTGRLFELAQRTYGPVVSRMPRRTVKVHLCASARAQDANIRVALMDRFGGKTEAIGRKVAPGPLFGIKSHEWSALAIAVTYWDQFVVKGAVA